MGFGGNIRKKSPDLILMKFLGPAQGLIELFSYKLTIQFQVATNDLTGERVIAE